MYGSSLRRVIPSPRFSSRAPTEEEANPFPSELTTPPVMKMYLVFLERMICFAKETGTRQPPGREGARRVIPLESEPRRAGCPPVHPPQRLGRGGRCDGL